MKYKIAIIDDEVLIRKSIRMKIALPEIEVVFDTDDGEKLLEYLEKQGTNAIDMILVDIVMPYMGGLELIERVKKIAPQILCVILSGYNDFCYMQKAIRLGVNDYIIKPVVPEILNETLNRMLDKIKWQREQVITECIGDITNWIADYSPSYQCRSQTKDMFLDSFPNGYFAILCLDGNLESGSHWLGIEKKEPWCFMYIGMPNLMITIYDSRKVIHITANESFSTLTFYKTEVFYDLEHLKSAVREGMDIIRQNIVLGQLVTIDVKAPDQTERFSQWKSRTENYIQIIHNYLKMENYEKVYEKITDLFSTCNIPQSWFEDLWRKLAVLLCEHKGVSDFDYIDNHLRECEDQKSYCMEILYLCRRILEKKPDEYLHTAKNVVEKMLYDIGDDCARDLNLKTYADKYFLNRSHLSRVFKQMTNETFNEYLVKARVNKACMLLKTGSHKITEVAFLVGYEDSRYFSQIFMKEMGMSPRDYVKKSNEEKVG